VPSGAKALCTSNLDAPSIKKPGDNFNTILYDDGAGAKTGVGFQPDLVWVKSRGSDYEPELTDSVRGVTKALSTSAQDIESTDANGLTAFSTDGFTVGIDTNYSDTTGSGMAAWNWKADGSTTVTNDTGSIESEVSANTTAGFSIVTWDGTASAGTIGHGLTQIPDLIISKGRTGSADSWGTRWVPLGNKLLSLNTTAQPATSTNYWNDTDPTASVWSVGSDGKTNVSGDMVAYLFHSVEGYSKVGSYVGNGNADGAFIYTGFRPSYVICRNATLVASWMQYDATRSPYNILDARFMPNTVDAEGSADSFDFLSNGFKNRTSNANFNADASTYVYVAFAKYPFKYANAR